MKLFEPYVMDEHGRRVILDALNIHLGYLEGWRRSFVNEVISGNLEAQGGLRKVERDLQECRMIYGEINKLKVQPRKGERLAVRYTLLFVALALGLVAMLTSGCTTYPDLTVKTDTIRIVKRTGSMGPKSDIPLIASVRPVKWEDLKPGMVVIYRNEKLNPGGLVHHRIKARVSAERFLMKGDGNHFDDPGYMTRFDYVGVTDEDSMYLAANIKNGLVKK